MTGIALMIFLLVWGLVALFLSKMLWRLIGSFKKQSQPENGAKASSWQNSKNTLLKLALAALIFVLPVADEIISYPSYYKMCEDGGKYQFAPGMDEKKVFGRKYRTKVEEEKLVRLFPTFQTLAPEDNSNFGVVIKFAKLKLVDDQTDETLFTTRTAKPLRSAFAIPWDGGRIPWLLHECSNMVGKNGEGSQKLIRSLQLHPSYRWD